MEHTMFVIMAAGEGKRMKSDMAKVLHQVGGKPMIERVITAANNAGAVKPIVVVGAHREQVMEYLGEDATICIQQQQLGTGHAVQMAAEHLKDHDGYTVILAGDMPLIDGGTLKQLQQQAQSENAAAIVLTTRMDDPTGYGRMVKDERGNVLKIVEEKDATAKEQEIEEVNSSVYCIRTQPLLACLDELDNDNAQGEYYLTDCIAMLVAKGYKVGTWMVPSYLCMGVNDRLQLAQAERILKRMVNETHLMNGVTMLDPNTAYIGEDVTIGKDVILHPNVCIMGDSVIEKGCVIGAGSQIHNSIIGPNTMVESAVMHEATVGANCNIGPYAYLRPDSVVGDNCKVGAYTEMKNASLGNGSKLPHLSYAGDCDIGENTNIGCGVVFVNYNGMHKYRSTVGDSCFIGSNVNLVAPVHVGDGAFVAAGTTVTEDVEAGALCIGRSKQVVKPGWADEKRKKGQL
ncbi:bifunctional UDP-N-acetylglucosamine diphosphorylase/glucosamine-1-phosphate N-acetyltransferase GlmU [Eubacteriales bacterium OttesenSCG-928-N14]|nr:bifunctional UDP-N-acetylglucosamine diphosphorylase/glucosamine-1-phosphate N-acetyltransferase GlmU [Eubacteriales bacterium OttesenSCG-928-N14]